MSCSCWELGDGEGAASLAAVAPSDVPAKGRDQGDSPGDAGGCCGAEAWRSAAAAAAAAGAAAHVLPGAESTGAAEGEGQDASSQDRAAALALGSTPALTCGVSAVRGVRGAATAGAAMPPAAVAGWPSVLGLLPMAPPLPLPSMPADRASRRAHVMAPPASSAAVGVAGAGAVAGEALLLEPPAADPGPATAAAVADECACCWCCCWPVWLDAWWRAMASATVGGCMVEGRPPNAAAERAESTEAPSSLPWRLRLRLRGCSGAPPDGRFEPPSCCSETELPMRRLCSKAVMCQSNQLLKTNCMHLHAGVTHALLCAARGDFKHDTSSDA